MPRRQRAMMPGFGNLSLGLPFAGQQVQPYQEGTGVRPPAQAPVQALGPVPVAPLLPPDQALAARSGVPVQAARTPEQIALGDQSRQASAAVRPAGYVKTDPLASGQPRVELPLPLKPLMPSPADMVTAQAAGRPMPQPSPLTPGTEQQWGTVAPGRRPEDMIPVAPLPVPGAGVQVPMRNPAVPVPVASAEPFAPAGPAGPVVDTQQGGMTITPGEVEALSRYGSESDRKRMEALAPRARAGNAEAQEQYTAIRTKLEGLQGEQQEKEAAGQRKQEADALSAQVDGLKLDEDRAQKEVARLEKESKDRDVGADLELAKRRLAEAQQATSDVVNRRAEVLKPAGVKPLAVAPGRPTGAKAGALALEALGIRLGPALKEQAPEARQDAMAAARVGDVLIGKMDTAVQDLLLGRRMKVATGDIDAQNLPVYVDVPDPRQPGLFDGKKLTYRNIEAAERGLRLGFSDATKGAGKQEADLAVARKYALIAWLGRNWERPEYQEAITEYARRNKKDWERIVGSMPVMDPAATQGTARQPGEQSLAGMKIAAGETAGAQEPMSTPDVSGGYAVTPRVRTGGPRLVTEPGAPQMPDLDRPGMSIPKPGAFPKGGGQVAPPDTLIDALRRTDKSLPRAQRLEEARRLLRDAGWKVDAAAS